MEFAFATDVNDEGQFAFNVPAGVVDLRIAAGGLAPAYRWSVKPRDGEINLGSFEMVQGGSLLGYVVDRQTGYPVPGATVTATLAGIEGLSIEDRKASRSLGTLSAKSSPQGSFQITAISPGAYSLRVDHPDYLATDTANATVVQDAETILGGDLILSKPLRLRVEMDPPRPPAGGSWDVILRDPVTSIDLERAKANADGLAEFDRLAPATFRLLVEGKRASGAFNQHIELATDLDLPIQISFVEIVGHITMNDEPVQGEVEVRTGASDAWQATLTDEGAFQVWSREPRFDFIFLLVKGEGFAPPPLVKIEDVAVENGRIELEVELLDLEISGVVTSTRGVPINAALVVVEQADQRVAFTDSGADGSFTVRPLQPGDYRVHATQQSVGSSQYETLVLSETSPSMETSLVIRPSRKLTGFVVGPSGEPVGGARILAMSLDHDYVLGGDDTDAAGRFVIEVAPDSTHAVLIIAARGYPFWSACLDSTQELTLRLPGSGGLLETQVEHGNKPMNGQLILVNELGGFVPFVEYLRWAVQHGGGDGVNDHGEPVFRVPNIAPGSWSLVWSDEPRSALVARSCNRTLVQGFDRAVVNPGETATLLLDRSKR